MKCESLLEISLNDQKHIDILMKQDIVEGMDGLDDDAVLYHKSMSMPNNVELKLPT